MCIRDSLCKTYIQLQDSENSCPDSLVLGGDRAVFKKSALENSKTIEFKSSDKNGLFSLSQNTPNPFGSVTRIQFNLPDPGKYNFYISDVNGKIIKSINGIGHKGHNQLDLDAIILRHSGIYYYTLNFDGLSSTKKMVIIN